MPLLIEKSYLIWGRTFLVSKFYKLLKVFYYIQNQNNKKQIFGKFHHVRDEIDNLRKLGFTKVWDINKEYVLLRDSIYSEIEQMLEI